MPLNTVYNKWADYRVRSTMYKGLNNVKAQEGTYFGLCWRRVTPDEDSEPERARRKGNKSKAMSCFDAELRRQADDEVQTVRELTQKKRG